jgi:DNA (cytosine-5)-methyltransferase 1
MKEIKLLNEYAGIGGNRKNLPKYWRGIPIKVTAVEKDAAIAEIYQRNFPEDEVIVADSHAHLGKNFHLFDIIWLSRPCQTHSSMRQNLAVRFRGTPPVYPDFGLYEEITFLQYNAKPNQRWSAENVIPYYEPLIKPTAKIGRHLFWSNFEIPEIQTEKTKLRSAQIPDLEISTGFQISNTTLPNKRQILRNCVDSEIGLHVTLSALRSMKFDYQRSSLENSLAI